MILKHRLEPIRTSFAKLCKTEQYGLWRTRKIRHWTARLSDTDRSGRAGRCPSSHRPTHQELWKTPFPSKLGKTEGFFESITRQPSCFSILLATAGIGPVLPSCPGAFHLLAVLHWDVCRASSANQRRHARLVRLETRFLLGDPVWANSTSSSVRSTCTSPEASVAEQKVEMTRIRCMVHTPAGSSQDCTKQNSTLARQSIRFGIGRSAECYWPYTSQAGRAH